ncbi:MAG: DUF1800 domain-containing protein [Pseudomonadota bacterium]
MREQDFAQVRFGYGFGPRVPAQNRAEMFAELSRPDRAQQQFPIMPMRQALQLGREFRDAARARRNGEIGAEARYDTAQTALRSASGNGMRASLARIVEGVDPLRERLTWFWADHFTAAPNSPLTRATVTTYVDEAIRPHIVGRFADMLKAVVRHPAMLTYLDQQVSIGPNSLAATRTGRGLNENFARELLELHTMGVGAGYTQSDVREAAELLTGLSIDFDDGFVFRPRAAEPGPETILGRSYGSDERARLADIDAFLEDLAQRPETAEHLAQKLAVHFVDDAPSTALAEDLAAVYRETSGHLGAVTETLMSHPDTATLPLRKVKPPMAFITSALIALGLGGSEIAGLSRPELGRMIVRPLAGMGQMFMRPAGPDGWPEDGAHWITPQGLATRISWATAVADRAADAAGDPRSFLDRTLGALAGPRLQFAVSAAETRAEGIALVLASAEFNRR